MVDTITKLSELEQLEFNLTQIEAFRQEHARQTLTTLVNQHIVDVIQNDMRSANYSPKIIDRTFLDRIEFLQTGDIEIHIRSDYTAENGFAVADAREFGTTGKRREPVNVSALSFLVNGQRVFSKGHFVRGIVGSRIIENIIQRNTKLVQSEFERIENQWVQSIVDSK